MMQSSIRHNAALFQPTLLKTHDQVTLTHWVSAVVGCAQETKGCTKTVPASLVGSGWLLEKIVGE